MDAEARVSSQGSQDGILNTSSTFPESRLRQNANGVSSVRSGPTFTSSGTNKAMVYYETQRSAPPAFASLLISQQFSKLNDFFIQKKDIH